MDVIVGLNNDVEISGEFLSVELRQSEENGAEFVAQVELAGLEGPVTSVGNLENLDELLQGLLELRAAMVEAAGLSGHVRFHNGV